MQSAVVVQNANEDGDEDREKFNFLFFGECSYMDYILRNIDITVFFYNMKVVSVYQT